MTTATFLENIASFSRKQHKQQDPTTLNEYYDQVYVKEFLDYSANLETIPTSVFKEFTDCLQGKYGKEWLRTHASQGIPLLMQKLRALEDELSRLVETQNFTQPIQIYALGSRGIYTITRHIFDDSSLAACLARKILRGQKLTEDEEYMVFKLGMLSAITYENYQEASMLCFANPYLAGKFVSESEKYLVEHGYYKKYDELEKKIIEIRKEYNSADADNQSLIIVLHIHGREIPVID